MAASVKEERRERTGRTKVKVDCTMESLQKYLARARCLIPTAELKLESTFLVPCQPSYFSV